MNISDGTWQACPYEMYFDFTLQTWNPWGSTWNGLCAYREACFKWPVGQIFFLHNMTWVTEWTENYFQTTYTLKSGLDTFNICRPLDYYVNPNSEKIMELGTIEYPFRDINLVFTEIYNEHQQTERVINIYLMENTDNYLPTSYIEIFNVTQVNIDSYSQSQDNNSKYTNFKLVDSIENVNINTSKYLFNVIQNQFKGDFDTSGLTESELNEITSQSYTVFLVYRSSVSLNHINIYSEFTNKKIDSLLMYTSYCFEKTQTFMNMYMDFKGQVYSNTYATTNIYAENITLNMSQASGGFQYKSACNFEGKLNLAEHVYKNIYTFTKTETPLETGVINTIGNCNTTVSNITIQVFTSSKLSTVVLGFLTSPAWVPQDDVLQYFNIDNVYSTMPENPTRERAGYIIIITPPGSTRKYQYIIKDSIFDDRNSDPRYIHGIIGQFIESTIMSNITHTNNQISDRIFGIIAVQNLRMNDMTFTSNIFNGRSLLGINSWIFVTLDNIMIDDNKLADSPSGLIEMIGVNSVFQITNLNISNWDLHSSSVLYLEGIYGRITISGINAENLTTDTDASVFEYWIGNNFTC